ncbi:RNA 3'-terminal phosphate cyclase [Rubripirellula tenax]|uniref:RNA 3'-terminal phosphate cyclase n=1 Tax=Rubripirellula tenax TaxID=2528015 RepID=A0A5C6ED25_9BACT|nr:RNA 3'-terminal phosphate cyclase [Rubripirellula tenax]TWU46385.1 RNA 3'-terminal phosphate cyclase [Rubripirellula tenax]
MIEINGTRGEGGGQIVRSSLALAAVTGQPVRIDNIRGGRTKPGLLRQHLTGVRAITQVCSAATQGDELGSATLTFEPSRAVGGNYTFEVGSAGSAILVAQTILPALLSAEEASVVTIGGGTHASWAPPFDFFDRCFLPLLRRMGGNVEATIHAHGFYPAGGGEIELRVEPIEQWQSLSLLERTGTLRPRVQSLVSKIPISVANRECNVIRRKANWDAKVCEAIEVPRSGGPGNVVMIELGFDNVTELFIGIGKVGVRAEQVARSTLREARSYLAGNFPVGQYLADQLLLPMGIAASCGQSSEMRTGPLSLHSQTHIEVLQQMLDIEIAATTNADQSVRVSISPKH